MLLDYARWADEQGLDPAIFSPTTISVDVLEKIAASQNNTTIRPGDILFVRSGYVRGYDKLTDAQRQALADDPSPPAIGLESSEAMVRWLWDKSLAAIVGDQPSVEAWPVVNEDFGLHEWLLAGWGMPLGELFDLERLSEECKKRSRWSFFFTSMPLKVSHFGTWTRMLQLTYCRSLVVWPARRMEWQSSKIDNRLITCLIQNAASVAIFGSSCPISSLAITQNPSCLKRCSRPSQAAPCLVTTSPGASRPD